MASIRFFLVSLLFSTAFSLPISRQQPLQTVECHTVDRFTPDWFLRNTLPQFRQEIHGKALFYTKGASQYARQLACRRSSEYVSLWQIWEPWLYDDRDTPSNPLRCIHNDHEKTRTFYENMSEAYARMARRHATVMHMSSDYDNPPQDGIWGRVELPALRHQTDITEMNKTNENGSRYTKWFIPNKGPKAAIDKAIEEVQRIFRSAKYALTGIPGANADACTLWASHEDGFLDSLW